MNVIPGCTDRNLAKFSITANFDDGSCKTKAVTGLALGGIYQTCEPRGDTLSKDPCVGVHRANALTGKLACPDGFTSVLLHEGTGPYQTEYKQICDW
ncbi:macrophage expressed protein 1-like protein [Elysia marginata]|uniref:Macrophage expressed protein 1-like protein n=1 Tax=Elysia marginata TaxID=1093978 RepID=A0AAV4FNJ9_9GAST|nr:macrophage expressed protein 1-like protein [Elysia marginata]